MHRAYFKRLYKWALKSSWKMELYVSAFFKELLEALSYKIKRKS